MTKDVRPHGRLARWTTLALCAASCCGCIQKPIAVRLISYKDSAAPREFQFTPDECVFRVESSGDQHVLARAVRSSVDSEWVEQLLYVHIFWRPNPGKTFDNSSSVNATLLYVIRTDRGEVVYSGTGYVYAFSPRGTSDLMVSIEDARWRLSHSRGDVPELLGETRVAGRLVARQDTSRAVELLRRIELRSGRGD